MWFCLKARQMGFGPPALFAAFRIVFQVSESVGRADILDDPRAEWETEQCQQYDRKIEMTLRLLLKEINLKSTTSFLCPLLSEEV